MLPATLIKGFDERRLKRLLTVFFLALAVPTAALIWQAYSQLKWESFHQHRGMAEELTSRIDSRLIDLLNTADGRSFADYAFLVVTGDPSANFVQRSPLSAYPVEDDLPGVTGYFQVDSDGSFSTPLLPPGGTDPSSLGITHDEFLARNKLAAEIQAVLADNQLVRSRPDASPRRGLATEPVKPASIVEAEQGQKEQEDKDANAALYEMRNRNLSTASPQAPSTQPAAESQIEEIMVRSESAAGGFADESAPLDRLAESEPALADDAISAEFNESYDQQVFDQLNQPRSDSPQPASNEPGFEIGEASMAMEEDSLRKNTVGKVSDIKLDASLQMKSEDAELEKQKLAAGTAGGRIDVQNRQKRREQTALPESTVPAEGQAMLNVDGPADLRINTFESELDPFEFSLLDSGHFVIFRKVWRDGERYIQGLLLDQNAFVRNSIEANFSETALFSMSSLIVAYQDDVIHSVSGRDNYTLASSPATLGGELLYRSRLSAPLDSLELIFSIRNLPAGPGASVLGWVTFVLAVVFVGGFITLYRLGLSQIQLARQQQDFVSAVSHELKTPLTSIRMYGEMLKEGWADEEKRQSYYEFIHDESERLTRMISNVLQLANITRNEPQFDLRATNVGELMSNIESKIGSQVERAGFSLIFDRDAKADKASIDIDDDSFAQIIINLVDNAIKFSKNAGVKTIEICSSLSGDDTVSFSVRDHGPGIPKDQMKKIFKLFYRTESELTRETVGTGIGLAIVHQLTNAMGGSVDVVNVDPGVKFTVSFAAKAAPTSDLS
jgi:signal transduction histidine kinase